VFDFHGCLVASLVLSSFFGQRLDETLRHIRFPMRLPPACGAQSCPGHRVPSGRRLGLADTVRCDARPLNNLIDYALSYKLAPCFNATKADRARACWLAAACRIAWV
jgi:hypothetical protein